VIEELVFDIDKGKDIGKSSRQYVEKYHSIDGIGEIFQREIFPLLNKHQV
jgi:hypothetical protein